ncbi:hypothetical protein BC939DRAFT_110629 [Gamsiella multidivaricata]|uniref:uncharacterized protein n=1 Tax=Gamsiella multidivaricata TaxID=101098 RepID=UPI002220C8A8|nr:uncharacterized protein BC939DRAFT_110629 [Gamsiella multidivaricata]KAI7827015.1 hypothetical protein BC939DRAFT_110629 [Gamsiella multidivaricata]
MVCLGISGAQERSRTGRLDAAQETTNDQPRGFAKCCKGPTLAGAKRMCWKEKEKNPVRANGWVNSYAACMHKGTPILLTTITLLRALSSSFSSLFKVGIKGIFPYSKVCLRLSTLGGAVKMTRTRSSMCERCSLVTLVLSGLLVVEDVIDTTKISKQSRGQRH